jgi:hypothetical protein
MDKMKKSMKIFEIIILLSCVGISGCITDVENLIIDDNYYQNAPRDPFIFNDVKLKCNYLILNVSYSGGCEEHVFKLIATTFMESYPIQVNVVLSHVDNDDTCEAWITEEMMFNLLPLKNAYKDQYNEKSGKIILNLENWEESITFKF